MRIRNGLGLLGIVVACAAVAAEESAEAKSLRAEIGALRAKYAKENRPLGIPDEFGVYNLTEEGKEIDALEAKLKALTGADSDPLETARRAGWGTKPLGPKGMLATPTTFANKPDLGPRPAFKPGLALAKGGKPLARIYAPTAKKDLVALAKELKYHLDAMTDASFELITDGEPEGPAVAFGLTEPGVADDGSVIRRKGDVLWIGGNGAGPSHALTYVLESIGCRYLWPGKLGKFIPKKADVVLPEMDFAYNPQLVMRAIRAKSQLSPRHAATTAKLGFEKEAFERRQDEANCDHPGNRSFWHWHGVNDCRGVPGQDKGPGKIKWGHYYKDYIVRYMKDHPDWFALQPDGTRNQSEVERPCFCLTNEGLIEETIRNLVRDFGENPDAEALSACLPDGGHSSPCMCERCRRLDPPNAEPRVYTMFAPKRGTFDYYNMTDRVLWFMNRLADGVAARLPGRKLTTYAYSYYTNPPLLVPPSTNLVILSVAGDYVNAYPRKDGKDSRNYARENMAAWSSFGLKLLWRPNAIRGFNCIIPQNCSRRIFEDLELFKANGTIGTDFDTMDEQWALKGLTFYMTAKGHHNIDRLDYDTLLDDYCAAFGPAKDEMKGFFLELERTTEAAADLRCGIDGYITFFEPAKFEAILDRAEAAAKGDGLAVRRVRFFRTGLEYAKYVKRNKVAQDAKDPNADRYLDEYVAFIRRNYGNDDTFIAVNPRRLGFYDHYVRPYLNRKGK